MIISSAIDNRTGLHMVSIRSLRLHVVDFRPWFRSPEPITPVSPGVYLWGFRLGSFLMRTCERKRWTGNRPRSDTPDRSRRSMSSAGTDVLQIEPEEDEDVLAVV